MGVPLGADHPPGGCPQQPRQVVNNDRPVAATPGNGVVGLCSLGVEIPDDTQNKVIGHDDGNQKVRLSRKTAHFDWEEIVRRRVNLCRRETSSLLQFMCVFNLLR